MQDRVLTALRVGDLQAKLDRPPTIGERPQEVLRAMGFSAAQIAKLYEAPASLRVS